MQIANHYRATLASGVHQGLPAERHNVTRSPFAEGRCWAIVTVKWVATLLLAASGIATAASELEFHLCSSYVQKSVVGEPAHRGWPVFVKLTELGARSLENFTETNVGRMARIVVDKRKFSRTTIRVPIAGGNLHESFSSLEVATAWQRTLADELPAAPCGAN